MKFLLFSKIPFEVSDPVALIESYCFQSDFYENYDLPLLKGKRKVEDVNKIGARIGKEVLPKCKTVTEGAKDLRIFQYDKYASIAFWNWMMKLLMIMLMNSMRGLLRNC